MVEETKPGWPSFALPCGGTRLADSDGILNSIVSTVLVVDESGRVVFVNCSGEQFLSGSAKHIHGRPIQDFLPPDNPLLALISQVQARRTPVSEYRATLEGPRIGRHFVDLHATPLADRDGYVVLLIQERSVANQIDRRPTHRGAARSMTAMAAMLAHEIKNPMSGIRGAAQLLEENLGPEDKPLARLIRDETDRVCSLVDRMDAFSGVESVEKQALNIHEVLNRVIHWRKTDLENTFVIVNFDPVACPRSRPTGTVGSSLSQPDEERLRQRARRRRADDFQRLSSRRDSYRHSGRQIQVNSAADGCHSRQRFRHTGGLETLLFDPFVTSKPKGSGLGLARVAKIIDDHGGVVNLTVNPPNRIPRHVAGRVGPNFARRETMGLSGHGHYSVADDDDAIERSSVGRWSGGFAVRTASNASTLWNWVGDGKGDLVITDVLMPDENGLDLVSASEGPIFESSSCRRRVPC